MINNKVNLSDKRIVLIFLFFIFIISLIPRLNQVEKKPFWADEGIVYFGAKEGISISYGHPPLFFSLSNLIFRFFDQDELHLRILSVISGCFFIIFLFGLGFKIFEKNLSIAFLTSLIAAFSPYLIQASQEARMYMLLGFFGITTVFFLENILEPQTTNLPDSLSKFKKRTINIRNIFNYIGFISFSALGLYTDHLFIIFLIGLSLYTIWKYINLIRRTHYKTWFFQPFVSLFISAILILIIYLPQLPTTKAQLSSHAGERSFFSLFTDYRNLARGVVDVISSIYYMSSGYFFYPPKLKTLISIWDHNLINLLLFFLSLAPLYFVGLGFLELVRHYQKIIPLFLAFLFPLLFMCFFEKTTANHFIISSPPIFVAMVLGIKKHWSYLKMIKEKELLYNKTTPNQEFSEHKSKFSFLKLSKFILATTLLASYVIYNMVALAHYYELSEYPLHRENWRKLGKFLDQNALAEDAIFTTGSRNGYFTLKYYYKGTVATYCRVKPEDLLSQKDVEREERYAQMNRTGILEDKNILEERLKPILQKHSRVWVVYEDWEVPVREKAIESLNSRYLVKSWEFGAQLKLFLYHSNKS